MLVSRPTSAQGPDSSLTKGVEPTPLAPATSSSPPFQIDRTFLSKIEPQLLKRLLTTRDEAIPFIVYLREKTDTTAVTASISPGIGPQSEPDILTRRTAIINALQQTARNTQAEVLQILRTPPSGPGLTGQTILTSEVKPLWIVNAVAAKGSLETVLALAAHPDVEIVRLDKTIRISQPPIPDSQFMNLNLQFPQHPKMQTVEWGINKIRADLVHDALGIDGTGVVVANIDSGVDWFHPALQTKYRGFTGSGNLPLHIGNWFDATGEGAIYPVDGNGHGSHTMGTMVGDNGIGVAPGAKWIAARGFNSFGLAQNSWLHAAFQWMLAPNGDPALAPDIVNNSWGNDNGFSTEFEGDVQALLNAGIYPVFSAGNNGPGLGTVGSPGSLDNAFSVGATTIDDEIALFSSRGPSPWGEIKPEVSAPGKNIRSSLPGGAFGNLDGTSMAAPHTSGLAALLLQASPSLANNLSDISNVMQSTAVDLGSPGPDNNYGAGRIDAFNAVMSVASAGILQGNIIDATTSDPIGNALIQITPTLGGPTVNVNGDINGTYIQGVAPDIYNATASAFGYDPSTAKLIAVTTNTVTVQDFSLTRKPTGFLVGTVKDIVSNAPLAATISIDGTPASTATNPADGSYSLKLPVGVYTATVIAAQYRITKAINITINNSAVVTRNFLLESAPSILLVDSGSWYQESQIGFYQQALDEALYPYDTWQITKPFDTPNDIPSAATLSSYDIVIWSSPLDSPGIIGADDEIEAFLNGGGKLLLSGQDVAFFDAFWFSSIPYLKNLLKVTYVQDNSGDDTISGLAGEPFDGLSFTISGGDGANNQDFPDIIANADADFAGPLLAFDDNNLAGLHVGVCVPYRAMFFSFGFEAINSQTDRSQVMQQTIDWLMQTPAQAGVQLTPAHETLVGNFGATVSHTIRLRNTGTNSDVFNLSMTNGTPHNWPISAIPASIPLDSCQSQEITANVQVPAVRIWHISDTFTVTAQSTNNSTIADIATRSTKTPAPVLLVDDDRFFSFADEMKEGLDANNIPYDYWFIAKSFSGPLPPSPPLETLQMYPMTVWYTAYDWFQPLLPTEEDRLAAYLDGGGRLLFSSQDFLFNHLLNHGGSYNTFAQDYLGVQAHTEDFSSTLTIGQLENPVGSHLGPYTLSFPAGYNNWTDALTPTATARIATRGQDDQPNSLINAGVGPGGDHWHTAFLAYGPELLNSGDRARLMQRSIGWLSWLGSSTIKPQTDSVANGALITYSTTITNNGWEPISTAYFTTTFPSYLTPVSASPGVSLIGGEFTWNGPLAPNQSKSFTYTAQIVGSFPPGSVLSQTSWLAYDEHNILFDRIAAVRIAPDLSGSSKGVTPSQDIKQDDILIYTIVLKNDGPIDAPVVTTTDTLPSVLDFVSIDPPSSGAVISSSKTLTWTTSLAQGQMATLTFRARVNSASSGGFINNVAYARDGINEAILLSAQAEFKILPLYLPLIFKN